MFMKKPSRMASDPVLLVCPKCRRKSWVDRPDMPKPESANTFVGTWLRCGYDDCRAPIAPPTELQ